MALQNRASCGMNAPIPVSSHRFLPLLSLSPVQPQEFSSAACLLKGYPEEEKMQREDFQKKNGSSA